MKIKLIFLLLSCVFAFSCGKSQTNIQGELSNQRSSVQIKFIKKEKAQNLVEGEEIKSTDADYFATTDSNGKFSVKIPNGEYIAAADIFDSTYGYNSSGISVERFRTHFYWRVEFNADGGEKKIALNATNSRGKTKEIPQTFP